MGDDRAVSEVVGFVLVFTLVLGTISFVYVGGFTGLQDTRDHEQMANAERAFDVLANNFEELGRGKAPSRATEIKLAGAQLRTTEPTLITVNSTGMNSSGSSSRPIIYRPESSRSRVIYEAGAVIRDDGDGATMIREPDFVFGPNRSVMRVIEIRGGLQSTSGDKTSLVRGESRYRDIRHQFQDSDTRRNVTIRITPASGHLEPWLEYLDETLTESFPNAAHECSIQNQQVVCTDIMTHSVYFGGTGVEVEII